MGYWERSEKRRQPVKPVHPRLQRLDSELMGERLKSFDYLYAIGQGCRIRCCVMRNEDNRCFATAEVAGRVLRVEGGYSPSFAFTVLSSAIERMLNKMTAASLRAVQLENPITPNVNGDPLPRNDRRSLSASL
jgi:hypothetical protein